MWQLTSLIRKTDEKLQLIYTLEHVFTNHACQPYQKSMKRNTNSKEQHGRPKKIELGSSA